MSEHEQRAKDEPENEAPPQKGKSTKGKAVKSSKDTGKKPGIDYVFKIAPADPKNAFDFEDVADK